MSSRCTHKLQLTNGVFMAFNSLPGFNPKKIPGFNPKKIQLRQNTSPQTKPTTLSVPGGGSGPPTVTTVSMADNGSGGRRNKRRGPKGGRPPRIPDFDVTRDGSNGNGDGSKDGGGGGFNKPQYRTVFYDETNSAPVNLDLRIPVTTHLNELRIPSDIGSSLFDTNFLLTYCWFTFPTDSDNDQNKYLKSVYQRMSREVISKVRSRIVQSWTFFSFIETINKNMRAVSLFYFVDSILSYRGGDSGIKDRNLMILKYQAALEDFGILSKQNELRRAIRGLWLPPKLSQLLRWLYQIRKYSDLEQDCSYIFCPEKALIKLYSDDPGLWIAGVEILYQEVIDDLTSTGDLAAVNSILADIRPDGRIEGLPRSCNTSTYDASHAEIAANLPSCYLDDADSKAVWPYTSDATLGDRDRPYWINTSIQNNTGVPFILQSMFKNENDLDPTYAGITTGWTDFTGKDNANKFYARYIFSEDSMGFAHRFNVYGEESNEAANVRFTAASIEKYIISQPGFQDVYYNNLDAPIVSYRDMMDELFEIR